MPRRLVSRREVLSSVEVANSAVIGDASDVAGMQLKPASDSRLRFPAPFGRIAAKASASLQAALPSIPPIQRQPDPK